MVMTRFVHRIPRNAALLVVLLLLIIASPSVSGEAAWFIVELLFDLVLVAGVYSIGLGAQRWPFITLMVLTLGMRWGELLSGYSALDTTAAVLSVTWLVYAIALVVAHLFQRRDVSLDTILGAMIAYLLAAIAFSMLFQIIELHSPGSFIGFPSVESGVERDLASTTMYFSLVCLTTMGFGDIVPVSALARPVAVIEGVFGQLYLAVMIARLVGLHIAHGSRDDT
jgi:hypothetical protein